MNENCKRAHSSTVFGHYYRYAGVMDHMKGRVAVVTGASAGIGAALAIKLVEAGLVVVGMARRLHRLQVIYHLPLKCTYIYWGNCHCDSRRWQLGIPIQTRLEQGSGTTDRAWIRAIGGFLFQIHQDEKFWTLSDHNKVLWKILLLFRSFY